MTRRSDIAVSVVIPAYNSAEWIGEALESVLRQTLDSELIQVVVVNDGSTDETGAIADRYAAEFPTTITVIHQENQGVAAALNKGVSESCGKYITFLGSDDYLSENALESVFGFFEKHYDECDLVAIQIQMFGEKTGPHWNNRRRFTRSRIIDVVQEWNNPHLHGGGTFIKAEALASRGIEFDHRLFISEDATVNGLVILDQLRYGVVADAIYYNRRHPTGGSLVSAASQRTEFYTGVPAWAYLRLIEESLLKYDRVPEFIQTQIAYDLAFRFRDQAFELQIDEVRSEYLDILRTILGYIEDEVILAQKNAIEEKLSILGHKYNVDPINSAVATQGSYYLGSTLVYNIDGNARAPHRDPRCSISRFEWDGETLRMEGLFHCIKFPSMTFGFIVDGIFIPAVHDVRAPISRPLITGDVPAGWRFMLSLPLLPGSTISPAAQIRTGRESQEFPIRIRLQRYTRFAGSPGLPYYRRDGNSVFSQTDGATLRLETLGTMTLIRRELGFARRALKNGARARVIALRLLATMRRHMELRPGWIMGDHKLEAGDNAEALYRFLCATESQRIRPVFWIRRASEDYRELTKIGRVVEPDSFSHKLEFLSATWSVSSAADEYVLNPVGHDITYLNDLFPRLQGFLQHGITKDDQSSWLNRWNKGFDLFVTSAERERTSILADEYGYTEDEVILTGMPRYDRLEDSAQGIVLIAPTWRRDLAGKLDPSTGRNAANDTFEASEYYQFWQHLITDGQLNRVLEEMGFRGVFALHPSHATEVPKFKPGRRFSTSPYPHNYRELLSTSSILVTDYSSVAFDFAYLRKPVVYAHSDREEFFSGHLYRPGYFSYEKDGFGPVTKSYDETLREIIDLVKSGARLEPKFEQRVNDFFAFSDQMNSRRVYEQMERIGTRRRVVAKNLR